MKTSPVLAKFLKIKAVNTVHPMVHSYSDIKYLSDWKKLVGHFL